ncbi:18535_t:CDS:2, partial [Acaulospora morrowiae]
TVIESDVQFVTFGAKPNTEIIKTLDLSLLESDTRLVKVKPTLELDNENYDRIFAAGDITNIQETKMAFRATQHADIVVKNVLAKINNNKLSDYQPMSEVMFVTIGKNKGAGLLPIFGGLVVGSFLVKQLKGKDLTVDSTWKTLNAKQQNQRNFMRNLTTRTPHGNMPRKNCECLRAVKYERNNIRYMKASRFLNNFEPWIQSYWLQVEASLNRDKNEDEPISEQSIYDVFDDDEIQTTH